MKLNSSSPWKNSTVFLKKQQCAEVPDRWTSNGHSSSSNLIGENDSTRYWHFLVKMTPSYAIPLDLGVSSAIIEWQLYSKDGRDMAGATKGLCEVSLAGNGKLIWGDVNTHQMLRMPCITQAITDKAFIGNSWIIVANRFVLHLLQRYWTLTVSPSISERFYM